MKNYHKPSRTNYTFFVLVLLFNIGMFLFTKQTNFLFDFEEKTIKLLVIIFTLLWAGFVLGISLHDAPLKFKAPSLTKQVAVDVGTLLFSSLNRFELLFTILINTLICCSKIQYHFIMFGCFLILSIECLWLQPFLDDRATKIIDDKPVEKSMIHVFYVICELLKFGFLIGFVVSIF
eukprot:gene12497-6245_t